MLSVLVSFLGTLAWCGGLVGKLTLNRLLVWWMASMLESALKSSTVILMLSLLNNIRVVVSAVRLYSGVLSAGAN